MTTTTTKTPNFHKITKGGALPYHCENEEDLRAKWDRRDSKVCDNATVNGIEYLYELASSDGLWFCLLPHEDHTAEDIAKAKDEARAMHDIVRFGIQRVPRAWYGADDFTPTGNAQDRDGNGPPVWLQSVRWVKDNGQARRMHHESGELIPENKRGGIMIDAFSAGMICAVVDAINEENRQKVYAMHPAVGIDICMKCYGKASK